MFVIVTATAVIAIVIFCRMDWLTKWNAHRHTRTTSNRSLQFIHIYFVSLSRLQRIKRGMHTYTCATASTRPIRYVLIYYTQQANKWIKHECVRHRKSSNWVEEEEKVERKWRRRSERKRERKLCIWTNWRTIITSMKEKEEAEGGWGGGKKENRHA